MPRCPACNRNKVDSDFYKDKRTKSGLKIQCKKCHIAGSNKALSKRLPILKRKARKELLLARKKFGIPEHNTKTTPKTFLVRSLKYGERVAYVDSDDYDRVIKEKWHFTIKNGQPAYLINNVFGMLHRFIMNALDHEQVDHKDGNGFNCMKSNLRICNAAQNAWNSSKKRTGLSSKYKGVFLEKRVSEGNKRFRSTITCNGQKIYLGYFYTEEEAALAYNKAALELQGEYAKLNIISMIQPPTE